MELKKKIGLFFGSFNPIHIGHLIIANSMVENGNLDKVWFVVTPHNPLKSSKSLLHEFDRLDLVQAAISDNYKFEASDVEFHLPKPSYTVYTLTHLTEKNPEKDFVLIMGEDNLENFTKWKNYAQILENNQLYVYPRPLVTKSDLIRHPNVKMVESPLLDISATFIRKLIRDNKSIRYLVPEPVERMIKAKGFYLS
ncbi:MAG TPA: nicotinate (nicotinamide) nucleotide adenylyltransferase [Cyclobacteriaceae bacterium]|nr:nicotinate (nicotinamide) nucleotide adenylyltransferase [Cyclobacteriaceae bacterium]